MTGYPYSRQRGLLLLFSFLLLFTGKCFANTFEWNGTSSSWTSAGSWTKLSGTGSSTYPGEGSATGDIAEIGVTVYTSGVNPILSSPLTIAAINFGGNSGNAMSLTVNAALTVTGTITQQHNSNIPGGVTTTLGGTGSVTCAAFKDGDATSPSSGGGSNSLTYYTTINCSINLTISGALTLNSTSKSHGQNTNFANPIFNLLSGNLSVNNIITSATSFVSGNTETFNVVLGSTNGLIILGQTNSPITIGSGGQVNFSSGSGTDLSTITYGASSGTQLIYASSYPHLVLSGNSTKTTDEGILTIGGSWTTSGGSVDLKTNSTVVSVASSWTNSAAVTQGNANISVYGDVSNSSGGSLMLGTGSFTVSGNFTNNGTFSQGAGNMVFNGTSKTLNDGGSGTVFKNVTFDGGGICLINSGDFQISTNGILTMANSTTLNVNNHLTLLSDASGSATVAAIPSGCSVTGTVYVQRFIKGSHTGGTTGDLSKRGYRLMSATINSGTSTWISDLQYLTNYIFVSGYNKSTNGFNVPTTSNPSIYLFREDCQPPPSNNTIFTTGYNWKGVASINGGTSIGTQKKLTTANVLDTLVTLPAGNGFLLYFRGNNTAGGNGSTTGTQYTSPFNYPDDATLVHSGTLNQGTIPVTLWYAAASGLNLGTNLSYTSQYTLTTTYLGKLTGGFNLVGNPYPSTINWEKYNNSNASGALTGTVSNTIYEFDEFNHQYVSYIASQNSNITAERPTGLYTGTGTNMIASGQGFFVVATAKNQTLTFTENAKSTLALPTNLTNMMSTPQAVATANSTATLPALVRLRMVLDSNNSDEILIALKSNTNSKFVSDEDALDLGGNGALESLSVFSSDSVKLALNQTPFPGATREIIPLSVDATASHTFQLTVPELRNISKLYSVWLKDSFTGDSVNLKLTNSYSFSIDKTNPATYGSKRFTVIISQDPAYAYHLLSFTAARLGSSSNVETHWQAANEENYTNFIVERSANGGKTFTVVGGIWGTGAGNYSLMDKNVVVGTNLYRLKSEDINNTITYSNIATVVITDKSNGNEKLNVYPNPATSVVNLDVLDKTKANTSYNIIVSNSTGFIVKQAISIQPNWQANISDLMPGTYLVRVTNNKTNDFIGESKFIKL